MSISLYALLSPSALISALCLSAFIPAASAASFSDVPSTHPNAEAIAYVKDNGLVGGYPDGTYRPNATINRAEFTKILIQAQADESAIRACYDEVEPAHWAFVEHMHDEWYAPYVCYAKKFRLVDGYPDGTFRPAKKINVAEASKIIANVIFGRAEMEFEIAHPEPWYAEALFQLTSNHYLPVSIRSPVQLLTRGEMAEIIYRWKTDVFDKPSPTYEELVPRDSAQASDRYDFVLRYLYETGQSGTQETWTDDSWEGSIVRRDRQTGKETVVVQSIKQLLPALRDRDNHTLFPFAQPSDELVIFQGVWAETDSGGGPLYAFDTTKKTLRAMNVNTVPTKASFELAKDTKGLSSDESKLLWVPDRDPKGHERVMYLSDLVNDSSRVLVQLRGNETFDAADFAGGIGSQYTDVSWTNDHTVRYAVFDQSKKPASSYDGKNILIEYRTVQVP